jgi:hypothetical protein
MNVGMLWFDNDPRTALTAKIERAADYFRNKYGHIPDLCLVHPSMLAEPLTKAGQKFTLNVRPNRLVLPGHLWIGNEEKN